METTPIKGDAQTGKESAAGRVAEKAAEVATEALRTVAKDFIVSSLSMIDKVASRAPAYGLMFGGLTLTLIPTLGEMGIFGAAGEGLTPGGVVASVIIGAALMALAGVLVLLDRFRYYTTAAALAKTATGSITEQVATAVNANAEIAQHGIDKVPGPRESLDAPGAVADSYRTPNGR